MTREEVSARRTKKLPTNVYSGNAALRINHLADSWEITLKEMDELMDRMRKARKKYPQKK